MAPSDAATAPLLPSFVQGAWREPTSGTLVRDASTGEGIARVGSEGLDLAAAVEFGRTVGQASLGALTFHERALRLKALALALGEVKEELYAVSAQTGATRRDSMVDIDGGIGVLFTYASKGRRELPNAQVIVDGQPENLARDGSFGGQHVYSRLPGVAFQVNAFNFPCGACWRSSHPPSSPGCRASPSRPRRPRTSPRPPCGPWSTPACCRPARCS